MREYVDKKKEEDIYELWRECFFDTAEYTDFYFRYKVVSNTIITLYHEDILTSMLHLNPYRIRLGNREILSNYIVGVATKKTYRRRGLMRKILTDALNDMYNKNMEFTYLMPAAEKIYYPYSFRYVYTQNRAKFRIENNDDLKKETNQLKHNIQLTFTPLTIYSEERVYEELVNLANDLLPQNFDCYVIRDIDYYLELQAEMKSTGGELILLYRKERIIGYYSYMVNGDEVEISECVVLPEEKVEAIKVIYYYFCEYLCHKKISNKDENDVEKLMVTFLETHFIKGLEKIISVDKLVKTPIIMARIVHLVEFVQHIKAKTATSIILKVKDNDIKQNEGTYELNFNPSGCEVKRTDKKEELTLSIAELTLLLFQGVKHKEIETLYQSNSELEERLSLIIPYSRLYINEIV
ncbi:GNAT family N-acetyltransferase [Anaeromicropila herbilytica]|uniref:Enhanced intracellular survival protein domain-containing protein n=1 Tax=Anaeromicropila herbilytica TaxID=2785025 RepID=A0A7R7EP50_9FIRM|nr:GNAT family N-acetyltransferase [Anaeromicropila herbilytica]BCN32424.1 hypothetical protein bsdtb5_37190 [Anaeromicropila herbilytica]